MYTCHTSKEKNGIRQFIINVKEGNKEEKITEKTTHRKNKMNPSISTLTIHVCDTHIDDNLNLPVERLSQWITNE